MKMMMLALVVIVLEPMLSFAQPREKQTKTFIGTNIGDGKPISNGSATLTPQGLFTVIYDYRLDNGLKNKVRLTAAGCKPNLQCDSEGFWNITKAAKGYVGPMQGIQHPIRVMVKDEQIKGFSL